MRWGCSCVDGVPRALRMLLTQNHLMRRRQSQSPSFLPAASCCYLQLPLSLPRCCCRLPPLLLPSHPRPRPLVLMGGEVAGPSSCPSGESSTPQGLPQPPLMLLGGARVATRPGPQPPSGSGTARGAWAGPVPPPLPPLLLLQAGEAGGAAAPSTVAGLPLTTHHRPPRFAPPPSATHLLLRRPRQQGRGEGQGPGASR
jgi:hypothetical protein